MVDVMPGSDALLKLRAAWRVDAVRRLSQQDIDVRPWKRAYIEIAEGVTAICCMSLLHFGTRFPLFSIIDQFLTTCGISACICTSARKFGHASREKQEHCWTRFKTQPWTFTISGRTLIGFQLLSIATDWMESSIKLRP